MLRAVIDVITSGWTEHPLHDLDITVETFVVLDRIRAPASLSRIAV